MKRSASCVFEEEKEGEGVASSRKATRDASYVRLAFADMSLSSPGCADAKRRDGVFPCAFGGAADAKPCFVFKQPPPLPAAGLEEKKRAPPRFLFKRKVSYMPENDFASDNSNGSPSKKLKKEVPPPDERLSVVPTRNARAPRQVLLVDHAWPLFSLEGGAASPGQFVVDLSGKLLAVNAAFCRYSGYDEGHLLGSSCLHLLHHDDRSWVLRALRDVALSGAEAGGIRMRPRIVCMDATTGAARARPFHMEVFVLDGSLDRLGGFIVPMSADCVERQRTPLIEWEHVGDDDDDDDVEEEEQEQEQVQGLESLYASTPSVVEVGDELGERMEIEEV